MRTLKLTTLALALAGAFQARAADPATTKPAAALAPAGMTEQQLADFNRIAIKTEALEDSRDAAGFKGLKISGYADPTFLYNKNQERAGFQFVVPAANYGYGYDNSYFGTISLDILKETDNGTKYHLNLIPKRGTGDFNDASIVNEASVWVPLDGDTKIFAGQIPDWSGYEYQSPVLNKLTTHNLIFDFTLPYYYTGVGIERLIGKLDLKVMVANFNTTIRQVGEFVPVIAFRGDYSSAEFWGLGFAGTVGNKNNLRATVDANPVTGEAYSTKDTLYTTFEVDGWYTRGDLTLDANVTWGNQQKAAIAPDITTGNLQDAQWFGLSVLAAYKVSPRLEFMLRGDYLYDQKNGGGLLDWVTPDATNGIGPNNGALDAAGNVDWTDPANQKGADKYAITAGLGYAVNSNVIFKLEYRYDGTTQHVFGNKDALTGGPDPKYLKNNSVVASSLVMYF